MTTQAHLLRQDSNCFASRCQKQEVLYAFLEYMQLLPYIYMHALGSVISQVNTYVRDIAAHRLLEQDCSYVEPLVQA